MTAKKKIGLVSIRPQIDPSPMSFDVAYQAIGLNTGNLMFTTAMLHQINANISHVGFVFDPAKVNAQYDALVVPAANWLGAHAQWDWFTDLIDKVEIPVITIGIGAQAPDQSMLHIAWNESSVRLARALAKRAAYISTRGHFTTACLRQIGILNVVTTGCPSLYRDFARQERQERDGLVIQSTRYGIAKAFAESPSLNRDLFRLAYAQKFDMIYQSEPEEMKYLLKRDPAAPLGAAAASAALCTLYGAANEQELTAYLDQYGKVFYDLEQWSAHVQTRKAVIGSRLHGAILALNSGVPAILIPHDSRTGELAQFARIPTAKLAEVMASGPALIDTPEMADQLAAYEETKKFNHLIYQQFLAANGLA